jgi:hypothetical protein
MLCKRISPSKKLRRLDHILWGNLKAITEPAKAPKPTYRKSSTFRKPIEKNRNPRKAVSDRCKTG